MHRDAPPARLQPRRARHRPPPRPGAALRPRHARRARRARMGPPRRRRRLGAVRRRRPSTRAASPRSPPCSTPPSPTRPPRCAPPPPPTSPRWSPTERAASPGAALARLLVRRMADFQSNLLAQRFLDAAERETYVRQNVRSLRAEYPPARRWRMLVRYLYELPVPALQRRRRPAHASSCAAPGATPTCSPAALLDAPRFDALVAAVAAICDGYAVDESVHSVSPPLAASAAVPACRRAAAPPRVRCTGIRRRAALRDGPDGRCYRPVRKRVGSPACRSRSPSSAASPTSSAPSGTRWSAPTARRSSNGTGSTRSSSRAASTAKTGWAPHHLTVREDGRLVAAAPMYLKGHSQGEFVFDHTWAEAAAARRHAATTPSCWSPCRSPRPPAGAS